MTDKEILDGLKSRDSRVTREYFYEYCRVAYAVYARRYTLMAKPGMDFYSLAHEYYLSLDRHGFRQLEDRSSKVSLKTWMINGFRFVLLDKLKATELERSTESLEERIERSDLRFDVADNTFQQEVRNAVLELCHAQLCQDSKSSLILQMMLVDGFKGKDVARQLRMTPSAVSQRYTHLMRDVVTPYFKRYFSMESGMGTCYHMAEPMMIGLHEKPISLNRRMKNYAKRITPDQVSQLAENEIFVFGSNLAGMHGGGAARTARLYFGAKLGQGVGLQGQSYAIPTMQGGTDTIRPYVDEFIRFAEAHPAQTFLVTRIGCGIAGFEPDDIAPLFEDAVSVDNIHLPRDFWPHLV